MRALSTDPASAGTTIDPAPPEAGGWIRRMWPFMAAHRRSVALAFGTALVGMLLEALTPLLEKVIVDDVIVHHRRALAPLLVLLVAAGVLGFGAAFVRRFAGGRVAFDVQHDLRNAIYERLQRLDFARHDELQTGQLVSRAGSDITLIQSLLAFLPLAVGNVLWVAVSLAVMLWLSPPLTVVVLVALPVLLALANRMRNTIFPASWDAQQLAGEVAGVVDEAVTGARVVRGFGQEEREVERLVGVAGRLYRSRVRLVRLQARFVAAMQAVPGLAQVAVLALGGWLAIHHRISLGTFLAFSSYLVRLSAPVRMFSLAVAATQQARAGAERLLDLLDTNALVTEAADAEALPPLRGDIELDDVRFGYTSDEPVLDGFSLRVRAGETVALVGASGSGKSTVALLLPRFYDVRQGAVRVDGTDVRAVTLDSLRRQIGVVFEESFLFSDSVRDNIAYGRPDATDDEVEAAARAAGAHQFISALPEGYATVVGERGLTLSGGQRQRVALARALLTDPRVLVLDDATSSVDSRTEEDIHATLRQVMEGRTTVLVAHRRSTLRLADRIVVVDGGRVADEGSHEDLLRRSALYRSLLAGPGESAEGGDLNSVDGTGREGAAAVPAASANGHVANGRAGGDADGVTPEAWKPPAGADAARPWAEAGRAHLGPGMGGGSHGPGGHLGAMPLAVTPELLASVDALPPADDDPQVDTEAEAAPDDAFTMRRFTGPYRRPLGLGLALVVLDTLLTLAGPLLVRRGLDRGVAHGAEQALWGASAAFLAVTLVDWADTWAYTRYTGRTAERMLFALRIRIFAHLQRLSVDFYDREMAGRVMTRMTTDVDALSQLLQNGLINAVVSVLSFAGVLVILTVVSTPLTLAAMAILPPLVGATWWFRHRSDRAYGRARERIAAVNANLQESLSGVRVAQAYVRERRNLRSFRRVSADYVRARLDAQKLVATYFPFVLFLASVADAIVLGVSSRLVASGAITAGTVIAFLLYLDQFFSPIQQLSHVFDDWQQARASVVKINELMATASSTPVAADPVVPGRLSGEIRFENVHFTYPGATEEALRGLDLEITAGETVAMVGETGAGKSTIVKLVARFYDADSGRVLVDGAPVTELEPGAYRRQLGYVPQEPFLFSGTIRDNIAYGRPEASDAEVERAARAVGAHDFVATLPGGYLHPVAERGRSMSAGQRQLICLARAQLVDPAILLLDEATANLDLASEARVQRAMGVVAARRTTLLIAHRLQTARGADRIVVIDGGRVVEQGSHAALLSLGGRYADMWRSFEVEAQAV